MHARTQVLQTLPDLAEQARDYAAASKAQSTLRAYRNDWSDFTTWCAKRGLSGLPGDAQTVVLYVTALADAGRKPATIQRRLVAISQAHQAAGFDSPTRMLAVRAVVAGIRRTHGTAQDQKAAVLTEDLRAMVRVLEPKRGKPWRLVNVRDRALLLLGFACAFRRSELVSLDVEDLSFGQGGLVVRLERSKTDQEGQGTKLGVPNGANAQTCPVRAMRAWLEASGIGDGPVFRGINRHGQLQAERLSDRAVALVVKRTVQRVGLDPAAYAGHSLRAGLATSAARAGVEERHIMRQTRHRSVAMVRRYIRDGELFRDNAAGQVGL